jgi:hypothetical protein
VDADALTSVWMIPLAAWSWPCKVATVPDKVCCADCTFCRGEMTGHVWSVNRLVRSSCTRGIMRIAVTVYARVCVCVCA